MGVQNFIPTLWETKILKELDRQHMIVKNCTTKYSGTISGLGSKVKINSINTPTIADYVPNVTNITPEQLKDESRMLEITRSKFFAFYLDDVDDKQTTGGILTEGLRKAVIGLKDVAEQFVATSYLEAGSTVDENDLTSGNVLSTLMEARTNLYENNVTEGMEVVLEVTPAVWQKMVLADIVYTDTGNTIRQGKFSPVLGMKVFMSNNLVVSGDEHNCIMRTKEAVGYAEQIMKTEKYKPENSFSEAVKGLHVYGMKVLKPKEIVRLQLEIGDETVI